MNVSMTERDKRLLYLVSVVGFVVLFVRFALAPAVAACADARQALADAQARQAEMEYSLALLPTTAQTLDRALADRGEADAAYYPLLSNDELDGLVTGLELAHGLTPRDLKITPPQPQSIPLYVASAAGADSAAPEAAPETAAPAQAPNTAPEAGLAPEAAPHLSESVTPSTSYLQTATLTCTASGSRRQFRALLDDLAANYPAVRLVDFSIRDTTYATASDGIQTDSQFTCTLAIYLCDKTPAADE